MRRNIIYLILILILLSCSLRKVERKVIYGTFYKLNKKRCYNTSYELEIRKDGTFIFNKNYLGANPKCKGEWQLINGRYILLTCKKDSSKFNSFNTLYMTPKECKIKVLNKNKLKFSGLVLKRNK